MNVWYLSFKKSGLNIIDGTTQKDSNEIELSERVVYDVCKPGSFSIFISFDID